MREGRPEKVGLGEAPSGRGKHCAEVNEWVEGGVQGVDMRVEAIEMGLEP